MEKELVCKKCQNPIAASFFFCPYCGKKLRQLPLSTSIGRQIWYYFLAIFFPYFTVAPSISYLRQSDNNSKATGIVLLLLTAVSLLINVYYVWVTAQYFNEQLNGLLLR